MPSQYQISPWGGSQVYKQFSVINGLNVGSDIHPSATYYATQDNTNRFPSGIYNYPVTSVVSADDVVTVYFGQTGNTASVAPGSVVMVAGTVNYNYTGMVIGGQSGVLQFIAPGFADTAGAVGTVTMRDPCWSTGYFFIPTYTSKLTTENQVINTKLGNGYEQRMNHGLNTFSQSPSFVYRDIGKHQMKAISHFVQTSAGVYPFEVLLPDAFLNNQPKQKFVADGVDVEPASFERYNVSVNMRRVYDV